MTLVDNKKAGFDYEFLQKFTAGIELNGNEVKSLRQHRGSLDGAYVTIRGEEAYLIGGYIPPYQEQNLTGERHDPYRTRRLLLTRREIKELIGKESQRGLTLVPMALYNKGRFIKLDFALARSKKEFDKRETIKKREAKREIERELKAR